MVRAVRPLRWLSMARGCARIDSRLDTAKMGSDGRVEVHHTRLLAVIGVRKRFHTAWVINGPAAPKSNFRSSPESGLKSDIAPCPFCAVVSTGRRNTLS
jgi:hypothetical protein